MVPTFRCYFSLLYLAVANPQLPDTNTVFIELKNKEVIDWLALLITVVFGSYVSDARLLDNSEFMAEV